MSLQKIAEEKTAALIIFIFVTVSVGLLIEVIPLFGSKSMTEPVPGLQPLNALQLAGRDIYVREGCYNCHSQMIRPFRAETERYGRYSVAGEFVYDHPFQFGSKRTGPDLARVGGRYNDEWHILHMNNPRSVVADSIMPAFPWLAKNQVWDEQTMTKRMKVLKFLGVPYTDEDFANVKSDLAKDGDSGSERKTELEALIAYLQTLGTALDGAE